jgi:hypothetical protein
VECHLASENSFGISFSTIGTNIDDEQKISYKSFHAFAVEIRYQKTVEIFKIKVIV